MSLDTKGGLDVKGVDLDIQEEGLDIKRRGSEYIAGCLDITGGAQSLLPLCLALLLRPVRLITAQRRHQ